MQALDHGEKNKNLMYKLISFFSRNIRKYMK